MTSNLGDSVFGQLDANVLAFIDETGKVVWAKSADLKTGVVDTTMVLTGTDGHPHYLVGKEPKSPFTRSI